MKNFKKLKSNNHDKLNELISSQSKRIAELKKENEKLYQELDKYRAQEREISQTLGYAKKQAESIISQAKIKYALECERIKVYRQKWTQVAGGNNKDKIMESLEKTFQTLEQCQVDMENMLANDLGDDMKSYIEERDRLNVEPCLNYQAIISSENNNEELNNSELEELLSQL